MCKRNSIVTKILYKYKYTHMCARTYEIYKCLYSVYCWLNGKWTKKNKYNSVYSMHVIMLIWMGYKCIHNFSHSFLLLAAIEIGEYFHFYFMLSSYFNWSNIYADAWNENEMRCDTHTKKVNRRKLQTELKYTFTFTFIMKLV